MAAKIGSFPCIICTLKCAMMVTLNGYAIASHNLVFTSIIIIVLLI